MKWKHKRWIAVWLILACAALLVTGTYAAYTKVEYVKRVVASKNVTETILFSSNYLFLRNEGTTEYPLRMIPVGTESNASVTVTICNYLQNDLSKINEDTITYEFRAKLADLNGNAIKATTSVSYIDKDGKEDTITGSNLAKKIVINGSAFDSGSITYRTTGTLTGETAQTDFYTITCSQEDVPILNAISIQIEAIPDGNSGQKLIGQLRLGSGFQHTTPWKGDFTGLPSGSTAKHDAFNYVISGTMEQTMRLKWDASKVTLGKWSREQFGEDLTVKEDGTWKYIDITVGAVGTPTSYTLQFYRVNGIPVNETNADVRDYVDFQSPDTANAG